MSRMKDDEGSFTIEASMLLPMIMCITMLLLFFCLYSYQKSMLQQVAEAAVERASYNWDNSHKKTEGMYAVGEQDSLYWRIGEDGLLTSLFGMGAENGEASTQLPDGTEETSSLPVVKLQNASRIVPANLTGEMKYTYSLTGRKISVGLRRVLNLPVLDEILSDEANPEVSAQSVVAEPVEFIRTVDLMRYYGAKFSGKKEDGKAGDVMEKKDASAMMTKLP